MIAYIQQIIAQIDAAWAADIATRVGWPGIVLWIVASKLDQMEHTMRGLSKALWMDLAQRSTADDFIRKESEKMLAKMEAKKRD